MRQEGKKSFEELDYAQAVGRYRQIDSVLKGVKALRPEENAMLQDARHKARRNLTIAALKDWQWQKALKACNKVWHALFLGRSTKLPRPPSCCLPACLPARDDDVDFQ